jgi:hypothetical protein
MSWIRYHKQTFFALLCLAGGIGFCGYAIIDYESNQCHYRELRGFDKVLGQKGWCRIL